MLASLDEKKKDGCEECGTIRVGMVKLTGER